MSFKRVRFLREVEPGRTLSVTIERHRSRWKAVLADAEGPLTTAQLCEEPAP